MGVTISKVEGLEGIDSRPNPNTMARVTLSDGTVAYAMSPSGASTGEKEQHEKRDGDAERYGGKGVLCTVEAIEKMVAP
ncbi:MAG: phosphopyruvate hydratase, partial [Candidatus Omnitrophica bacterium]|nr:phosphopyruvate hydratase [Candidatus Omnitrophota bacterium]